MVWWKTVVIDFQGVWGLSFYHVTMVFVYMGVSVLMMNLLNAIEYYTENNGHGQEISFWCR